MTNLKKAARQALEALTELVERFDYEQFTSVCELDPAKDTILTLREALAEQAERVTESNGSEVSLETEAQEPVAIDWLARACNLAGIDYKDFLRIKAYLPIAAPVRTKDLTDDEIDVLIKQFKFVGMTDRNMDFARAVIAADREKNK